MRTPVLCLFAACAVACGGGGPTDSASPGAPASVAIAAGDGQIAAPGLAVAVNPAALVLDAAGHPVPGVPVAFRVDSGGGTLASATATTGNNGVAAAGEWRLGVGPNVVIASVGTLPPVRFRAEGRFGLTRTLINGQVVGAGGGTLRYTQPGDPLSGLRLDVPANAYSGSTTWHVSADSTVQVPLPADFSQVGPVLVIGNDSGYAASLIAMTVPMRVSADNAVAPFFFDAASGTLEGVPLLARSDSNITFASRHFSGSLMAIPGSAPGPSGLRSAAGAFNVFRAFSAFSAVPAFGTIKMVFMRIPLSKLIGTFTSTFRPGQDDWEFANHGDYQSPNGMCEGMTATALYYHYFFTSKGAPSLFGRFDRFLTNNWDNVRGLHLAGAIQADYSSLIPIMKSQQDAIREATFRNDNETPESLAATWILLNLKANRRPLLVGVSGLAGSHALVAYEATATAGSVVVGIADPNSPGVSRTLTFQGGGMVPLPFRTIATGPENNFTSATVFGVTTEIPLTNFHSRWQEFLAGSPGEDRLPNPRQFEVYDSVNATWGPLPDTVRLVADTLLLRMRCPSCPVKVPDAVGGPDLIQLEVNDPSGTTPYSLGYVPHVHVPEVDGQQDYFVLAKAFHGGPRPSFVDGRFFTVIRGKLRLFPLSLSGKPDTAYTFTLTHGGLAKPDSRFVWNFGDGTPPATVVGDSIRTHAYTAVGNYTVTVEMRDGSNHLLGRTTSVVTITSTVTMGWRIDSVGLAVTGAAPGTDPSGGEPQATAEMNTMTQKVISIPSDGLFFLVSDGAVPAQGMYFVIAPTGTGATTTTRPPVVSGSIAGGHIPVALKGSTFATTGNVTAGTVNGTAETMAFCHPLQVTLNGTFSAGVFRGTLAMQVPFAGGPRTWTLGFRAKPIVPGAAGLRATDANGTSAARSMLMMC